MTKLHFLFLATPQKMALLWESTVYHLRPCNQPSHLLSDAADASLRVSPGEAEATLTNKVHRDSALGWSRPKVFSLFAGFTRHSQVTFSGFHTIISWWELWKWLCEFTGVYKDTMFWPNLKEIGTHSHNLGARIKKLSWAVASTERRMVDVFVCLQFLHMVAMWLQLYGCI